MPPVALEESSVIRDEEYKGNVQDVEETYSKPTIGIIYPPPEVRNIVDKTANFVARNGPEFEDRIKANEASNVKFNFLNSNDPYHAYYEHKLKEFREKGDTEPVLAQPPPLSTPAVTTKQTTSQIVEPVIPKEPPPEFQFVIDPPSISAMDLDVVKLTAQFVAKNGKQFLQNLMNREQRNYQFDFLRPQHSLFQYFTKLVEEYTKVFLPPGNIVDTLSKELESPYNVLDKVNHRVEWARHQEREKKREEDEKERERISFAQVDWHDFVVVETVNFREDEVATLPPPVTLEQLGARILAQERFEKMQETGEINAEEIEMEVEEEDDDEAQPNTVDGQDIQMETTGDMPLPPGSQAPSKATPAPPPMPNVNIRKDYDPKQAKQAAPPAPPADKFLISPLTGEKIPAESMAEHMKISLLDPRWKENKQRALDEKRHQENMFAEGVSIGSNLKDLAQYRSDIFGVGTEEALIGVKLGEEEKQKKTDKPIWDGHSASIERATKMAQSNITLDEQIEAIHKAKGLVPTEGDERIGPAKPKNDGKSDQRTQSAPSSTMSSHPQPMPPSSSPMTRPPPQQPPPMSQHQRPPQQPPPSQQRMPGPPMMPSSNAPAPVGSMPIMARPPMFMPSPPRMMMQQMPRPPGILGNAPGQPPRMGSPFVPPPMGQAMPPPGAMPGAEDEPSNKKSKMDGDDLMPEQEFMTKNPGPITFKVTIPNMPDRKEWNLHGQMLTFTLPPTDTISVVKAKISDAVKIPAGKQKLQLGALFIKDSNSLAYYNIVPSSVIQLQLKERGGRKK